MTKQISFYLLFFLVFLGCTDSSDSKNVERYVSKEIIIGNYDYKDGQPLIGKDDMRWWKVESDHITVDDLKRVFVIDAYNSRILQYSPEGSRGRNNRNEITSYTSKRKKKHQAANCCGAIP